MILHVGCAGFIGAQQEYLRSFRMVEIQGDASPAPKLATLRRWRAAVPEDFVFTLAEPLGDPAGIAPRVEALAAQVLVIRTPTSFTPTAANREALARYVGGLPPPARMGARLAWEPLGLWQRGEIERLVEQLGVIPCVDPIQHKEPLHHEGVAYHRVRGLGGPIGEREMERVVMACEDLDEAFIVFARAEDAQRFLKLLAES
jgi:uncharacterized protein YecE (DUF72 family)